MVGECEETRTGAIRSYERIIRIMAKGLALEPEVCRKLSLILVGVMAVGLPTVSGQVNAPPGVDLPEFEVASVKPDKSGIGPRILLTADGLTATKVTVKFLIKQAYGVEDDEISGAPNWLDSDAYDVDAKVGSADLAALDKLDEKQRMRMLRPLLAERFQLKVHRETKEIPVYALVIAKNGPKLHQAKPGDTYPDGIKGLDGKPGGRQGMMMWGRGRLIAQGIPIANLLPPLTQQLERTVLDKTGLKGTYDITLLWTPEDDRAPMGNGAEGGRQGSTPAADSSGASIFTAIQEQLGLKLESQKSQVEGLVIDHVERPSDN
jgi:uncharacterized protein (TIGR03435 family)